VNALTITELDELLEDIEQNKGDIRFDYNRRDVLDSVYVASPGACHILKQLIELAPTLIEGCRRAQELQAALSLEHELVTQLTSDLKWWQQHADGLDKNWSKHHETCMNSVRGALEVPDGSISELVTKIAQLKTHAHNVAALAISLNGLKEE
jgi:hypothetical protein